MSRHNTRASILFSIGLFGALLSLCLRLMAPAGWMPMESANGIVLALCSGNGSQQASFGKDGSPAPDSGDVQHGMCAFSGIGTPALPDVPPAVAIAIFAIFIALAMAATPVSRLPAISWLRPPLRGPPPRG
jgi:hypothetical protein